MKERKEERKIGKGMMQRHQPETKTSYLHWKTMCNKPWDDIWHEFFGFRICNLHMA